MARKKRKPKLPQRPSWTAFQHVPTPDYVAREADEITRSHLERVLRDANVFANNRYVCVIRAVPADLGTVRTLFEVTVRRQDRRPLRDWRDLQRIKNSLFGELAEGVELYPAESRLVDVANTAVLYVLPPLLDETGQPRKNAFGLTLFHQWTFGQQRRLVSERPVGRARQRPFPADSRPDDLRDITVELLEQLAMPALPQAAASVSSRPTWDASAFFTVLQQVPDVPAFLREALAAALPRLQERLGADEVETIFRRIDEQVKVRKTLHPQAAQGSGDERLLAACGQKVTELITELEKALEQPVEQENARRDAAAV